MALPLTGQISMNDIRVELGIPTQSPFSLMSASTGAYVSLNTCSPYLPNQVAPYSVGSWHGYCHSCGCVFYLCTGATCNDVCNYTI